MSSDLKIKIYDELQRLAYRTARFLNASVSGIHLGILDREDLDEIDARHYNKSSLYIDPMYLDEGLKHWEEEMIEIYFKECKSLIVGAVGTGREIKSLIDMGYDCDGFECNEKFRDYAVNYLKECGLKGEIFGADRGTCPTVEKKYEGGIVGWGAYTHIQHREARIAFLKDFAGLLQPKAPILISFFAGNHSAKFYSITRIVANVIRSLRGKKHVEQGDIMDPNYSHVFTQAEIESEARDAGLEFICYRTTTFGHAMLRVS